MSIFKRKRTIDGKVVKSNEYTVQFKDMSGVWRRVTAFVDKSASKQLDQGIQRLVDIRQVNGLLEATDNQFLEACPTHVLLKLVDWGIIDKHRIAAKKVVDEQIEDWITHLKSKNSTKKHVKEMAGYVKRTLDQCKWDRVSDINGDDFNALMVTLMDRGRSLSLLNHYIRAMKCFCNWLHSERRIIENPFKLIQKYNEQTDRRRYRRALTIDELGKLVGAADAGGGFVSGDRGFQKLHAAHVERLSNGHRSRERGRAGVVDGFAVDVVHLGGVRGRAVDECGGTRRCGAAQRQAGLALVEFESERFFDHGRGGHGVAREQGAVPVHQRALGVVNDVVAHGCVVEIGGVLAQLFAHEHGANLSTGGQMGRWADE